MLTLEQYQAKAEALEAKYASRVVALLKRQADALAEVGFNCDTPEEMHADEYVWYFNVLVGNPDESNDDHIGFSFRFVEQPEYEGEGQGITFRLDIVAWGGRILGGLAPGNYTDDCWLDITDEEAVEARFKILEECGTDSTVELVREYLAEKQIVVTPSGATVEVGGEVTWNDPDDGISSGVYKLRKVWPCGTVVLLTRDTSEAEAFVHELS